jgi:outer membrane lipoprotein carrier protein
VAGSERRHDADSAYPHRFPHAPYVTIAAMRIPATRRVFSAVAVILATSVLTFVSANASPDGFDDIYARGQQVNGAMKTLTARFTETTTSTLLTRPITARGRLWVERPSRVILRYTDPDTRIVLMDGKRMTVAWPSRNINQTIDITAAQDRVQKYFVNGTAADLRRQFEIETRDEGDGRRGAYYVSMVPKRKQVRETLARLELRVDRTSMLPDAMKMTFANGDLKTMTFEDVVANAPLDAGTFSLDR